MENMNLFDMFGIQQPEKKEEKKPVKKQNIKKELTYKLPITIYSAFHMPVMIPHEKEDVMSKDDIQKHYYSQTGTSSSLVDISFVKEGVFAAEIKNSAKVEKGELNLSAESRMFLFQKTFDLSAVLPDEKGTVDVAVLKKMVAEEAPEFGSEDTITLFYDNVESVIIPYPGFASSDKDLPESFPIKVNLLGRESMNMEEASYCEENPDKKISINGIKKILQKMYPDEFAGDVLDVRYNEAQKEFIAFRKIPTEKHIEKKKEAYPTDAVISLVFTKIPLSPELFGGEKEVEEKDIIKFLSKDYPEYSKERTRLLYDKKKNLIIPMLKSSTKGAELVSNTEHERDLLSRSYALYEKIEEGYRYRIENKEEAFYKVSMNGEGKGEFSYKLPKIPKSIYDQIQHYFAAVSLNQDTEAAVEIFWDKWTEEYIMYVPEQKANHASVVINMMEKIYYDEKYILVATIHSHGNINCSFSTTDDADEKATRCYGVFYGFKGEQPSGVDFRVSCGGNFLSIAPDEIFEI